MKHYATIVFFILGSASLHAADGPSVLAPVLQSCVDKRIAPGVVALVADKDRVLALDQAGYASLANKTPIREDAVFWIASMSKSLTGAALMMLVDQGQVSLDDPVEKYLPEFTGQLVNQGDQPAHPPRHPITVREIMNHTSGLVLASEKTLKSTQVLKDDVLEYAQRPLRQEPGTKYEYNNCGINTGGRIIEVVSGMSYAEFMQQRLFDPLGMQDTTCWPNEEQAARLAHTARLTEDKQDLVEIEQDKHVTPAAIAKFSNGVPVPKVVTRDMGFGIAFDYGKHYAMPAGGYFSTAHDLGRFCRMLLRGGELDGKRYLSQNAVRVMSTPQLGDVKLSAQESYGIGWSVKLTDEEGPSAGSFGHRGARRTAMWVDPQNGLALVLLVERFDMTGPEQQEFYGTFMKAAIEKYGRAAVGAGTAIPNAAPKSQSVPFPTIKLRGYGVLGGTCLTTETDGQRASALRITCQDREQAKLVLAKYLSDLELLPGVDKTPAAGIRVGETPLTVYEVQAQGFVIAARREALVWILAAPSRVRLESLVEQNLAGGTGPVVSTPEVRVPMYLDRWDKHGFRFCYGPFVKPHDANQREVPTYDPRQDFTFAKDSGNLGLVVWNSPFGAPTADGILDFNSRDWIFRAARQLGLPMGVNIGLEANNPNLVNRYPSWSKAWDCPAIASRAAARWTWTISNASWAAGSPRAPKASTISCTSATSSGSRRSRIISRRRSASGT